MENLITFLFAGEVKKKVNICQLRLGRARKYLSLLGSNRNFLVMAYKSICLISVLPLFGLERSLLAVSPGRSVKLQEL